MSGGGGRGMMSREVRRYHRLTVTWLTVYVRRTVNVAKSTPDRCARTYVAPWVDSVTRLTVYVRRTVKMARSTPDRCARTNGAP